MHPKMSLSTLYLNFTVIPQPCGNSLARSCSVQNGSVFGYKLLQLADQIHLLRVAPLSLDSPQELSLRWVKINLLTFRDYAMTVLFESCS